MKQRKRVKKLKLPRAPLPKQVGGAHRNTKKDPPRPRTRRGFGEPWEIGEWLDSVDYGADDD